MTLPRWTAYAALSLIFAMAIVAVWTIAWAYRNWRRRLVSHT